MTVRNIQETATFSGFDELDPAFNQVLMTIRQLNSSGGNTPNFRSLKKNQLPCNDYQIQVVDSYPILSIGHYLDISDPNNVQSYHFRRPTPTSLYDFDFVTIQQCSDSVASNLLNSLKSMDINVAQSFGERMQTVNLLATTASRFTTCFRHLKGGRLESAFKVLNLSVTAHARRNPRSMSNYKRNYSQGRYYDAAAGMWLEIQYGWRPLMNDIYGGAKALAEFHVSRETDSFFVQKRISRQKSINSQFDNSTPGTTYIKQFKSGARTQIDYTVDNPALAYSKMLGLTNPLLLAYELTPFSFVVDWFLPVGRYISNIDAAFGLTFLKGHSTKLQRCNVSYGHYSDGTAGGTVSGYVVTQSLMGPQSVFMLTRTVDSAFPSNPLPRFQLPDGCNKAVTAIALLVAVFSSKGKT